MPVLPLLFAAAAAFGGGDAGSAQIEMEGPPGARLLIDGREVASFGREGRLRFALSPDRHRMVVKLGERVLESRQVEFGAGSRIHLKVDARTRPQEWR
ncbi:MAG TPA: hypothetical protein VF559_01845 [Caulobacteraceae bacterium]|jgi:hypothetical protein